MAGATLEMVGQPVGAIGLTSGTQQQPITTTVYKKQFLKKVKLLNYYRQESKL